MYLRIVKGTRINLRVIIFLHFTTFLNTIINQKNNPYNKKISRFLIHPPLRLISDLHDADDQQSLQMISVIMDNRMDLVNPYGKIYTGLSRAAHIACEGPI